MKITFSKKINQAVTAYKSGDHDAAKKILAEACADSAIYLHNAHSAKLVTWLNDKLVASACELAKNSEHCSIDIDADYFSLLRSQYDWSLKEGSNLKTHKAQEIVHIEGGRPSILWGDGKNEIIGKESPFTHARKEFSQDIREKPVSEIINVVTPTFNSEKFLDSAIASIISQEGDFEIKYHVQDGGSTDSTIKKLKSWKMLIESASFPLIRCRKVHFSFSSERDNGMYDAISKGMKVLDPKSNDIMCWLNSDDVFFGGAFATALNIFKNNDDVSWIINPVSACDSEQKQLSYMQVYYPVDVISAGLCMHKSWRFIQQEGTFWRAQLWNKVSGLSSDLKLAGDWDLWRKFARFSEPVHVEWPLGQFRIHEGQLSSNIKDYYSEINRVVSPQQRDRNTEALDTKACRTVKVIKRPYKKTDQLKYEETPITREHIYPDDSLDLNLIENVLHRDAEGIKVLTMCTLAHGGAGTGSIRRVQALNNIGVKTKLVTLCNETEIEDIGQITPCLDAFSQESRHSNWSLIFKHVKEKTMGLSGFVGSDFFSTTDSVLNFRSLKPLFERFDIIHFHWMVGMLDFSNIVEALKGKPIVWTTADMNPFTGGCHYSEGCEGFIKDCSHCPLISNSSTLPNDSWQLKKHVFEQLDIHLVCPSNHIANLARKSSLLGNKSITVIPNAYPIHKFVRQPQLSSREKVGINSNKKLLLFGSEDIKNRRKGGDILMQVATLIEQSPDKDLYEIVLFGKGNVSLPLKAHCLGKIAEEDLKYVYSACDVFVSLSREDVGPMTVVESLLCGTPVVGFPVGIIPDVILPNITGYIAKPFSAEHVVKGIRLMTQEGDLTQRSTQCVLTAREYADPNKAARRHKALYERILGN